MNILHLQPAYGRSYTSAFVARKDWDDGKDFKVVAGPYMSKRDVKYARDTGFDTIYIYGTSRPDESRPLLVLDIRGL